MKLYYTLFFIFLFSCHSKFQLKEGDLLFQDLDSSPICDAIELVTPGYKGANFSHIGLIVSEAGELKVLEALPPKVMLTTIDDFLTRSFDKNGSPKVIVGRLKNQYKSSVSSAINFAKEQLGVNYDEVFLLNNERYYCSELIYEAFEKDSIFSLQPMTFLHPETKDTLKIWKEHYSDLGVKIPHNKLGINPGVMSLSDKIEIVHIYGIPDGMKR